MTLAALAGYTVLRKLGEGASGSVVLVRHDDSGGIAAVKILNPALSQDPSFLGHFRGEAEILRSLVHPNIAALYWYAETPDGALLAMEAIEGAALRTLVEGGATTPEAALAVLRGSLDALNHAHGAGVVHRDYKPENVLIDRAGSSHLVDFGIAVPVGSGRLRAGTPAYMAPEQWAGGDSTPATDVYAAGIVLFECLTGRRPFQAADLDELRAQHEHLEPPLDAVPPALRELVRRGMAKDASARHPTAGDFLRNLERTAGEAYGSDWERRGVLILAGAAVGALAVALPFLIGSGSASGAAATVAPVALSGGGAAGAGGVAAGSGMTGAASVGGAGVSGAAGVAGGAGGGGVSGAAGVTGGAGGSGAGAAGGAPLPRRGLRGIPRPSPIVALAGIGAIAAGAIAAGVIATRGGSTPPVTASPLPPSAVTVTAALNPGDGVFTPPGSASLADPTILPADSSSGNVTEVLTITEPVKVAFSFGYCDAFVCGNSDNAECTANLYMPGFVGAVPLSLQLAPPPGSHPVRMQLTAGPAPGSPLLVATGDDAGGILVSAPKVGGDGGVTFEFDSPIRTDLLTHLGLGCGVRGFTAAEKTAFVAAHGSTLAVDTGAIRIVVEWSRPSGPITTQKAVFNSGKKDLAWKPAATPRTFPAPAALRQDDPRWAQTPEGSTTLGAAGNVPTAIAALLSTLGTAVDPPDVAKDLVAAGAWTPGKGSTWSGVGQYLQGRKLVVTETTLLGATRPGQGAQYLIALSDPSGRGSVAVVAGYDAATDMFSLVDPAAGAEQLSFDAVAAANPWVLAVSPSATP